MVIADTYDEMEDNVAFAENDSNTSRKQRQINRGRVFSWVRLILPEYWNDKMHSFVFIMLRALELGLEVRHFSERVPCLC